MRIETLLAFYRWCKDNRKLPTNKRREVWLAAIKYMENS